MEDHRLNLMKNEKVSKAIMTMAGPAVIGMLVSAVYSFVDTVFVAWLGTEATAATQVAMPILLLTSAIGLMFGIGAGSFISRLFGMDKKEEVNKVTSIAFFSSIAVGIFFTVFGMIYLEPILRLFGASQAVMVYAKAYGQYLLFGATFQMASMVMNNSLRAEGSSKYSMIGMASGALINIVLDPILIFGFDLGISGAAIATSMSQMITFFILLSFYMREKSIAKIHLKHYSFDLSVYKEIFKIGIPTFLRQFLMSISIVLLNQGAVAVGGDQLMAAMSLVSKISMIPMYVLFGLGQGFQPLAGFNYASGDIKRVREGFHFTVNVSLLVAGINILIIFLFGDFILEIFRPDQEVLLLASQGLILMAIASILMSVSNTIGVYYQAIGKGKESMVFSLARQGFFLIPIILILPSIFGVSGILGAQLAADILTIIMSLMIFIPHYKKELLNSAEAIKVN